MRPNRYSKLWKGRMQEIARETLEQDDTDPLDLIAELEVQRVVLAVTIDRLNGGVGVSPDDVSSPAARAVIGELSRQSGFTSGRSSRHMLNTDTVGGGGDTNISSDFDTFVGGHTEFLASDVENVPSESEKVGISNQNIEEPEEIQNKSLACTGCDLTP